MSGNKFEYRTLISSYHGSCGNSLESEFHLQFSFSSSRKCYTGRSIFSLQELCRNLPVRYKDQWSVQNQSWWFGRIWSVLWSENCWRRLDSVPEEARWLCGFLPPLGWLQKGIRQSERRVLARIGQDSSSDCKRQLQASRGLGRSSWQYSICTVQFICCDKWKGEIPIEFGKLFRYVMTPLFVISSLINRTWSSRRVLVNTHHTHIKSEFEVFSPSFFTPLQSSLLEKLRCPTRATRYNAINSVEPAVSVWENKRFITSIARKTII